jgi:arylsulfatase
MTVPLLFKLTGLAMRKFILLSWSCLLMLTLILAGCRDTDNQLSNSRPNVVLILADDLGYSDLGCYGSEIRTPNLDRLAEKGIRFTQVYNTSKCFPSRACLLTGIYAQQVGMGKRPGIITGAITLGELFRMADYRTLFSGKHHGTENPVDRGFDRYYGIRDGGCNHFNPGRQRPGEGDPARKRSNRAWCIDEQLFKPYTPEATDFYTTDYFTRYALEWLEQYKDDTRPFFLYIAYTAPHDPLQAWPEDIEKYKGKYMKGYERVRKERFRKQKENGLLDENYQLPLAQHRNWDDLTEEEKLTEDSTMSVYAAMIDRIDQNVGKVLEKIRQLGKEDNTLVLFASDNGASAEVVRLKYSGPIGTITRWKSLGPDWANVSNTPLRYYKNYSHEGGIRTPMIACWPDGINDKGSRDDTPLHFIDILPTMAELAGVSYPDSFNGDTLLPVEGISFVPLLAGKRIERQNPLYFQWRDGRALRQGDWKIVSHYDEAWELYDLKGDPTEMHNLAGRYPGKTDSLSVLYEQWTKQTGAGQ